MVVQSRSWGRCNAATLLSHFINSHAQQTKGNRDYTNARGGEEGRENRSNLSTHR